jgi:hypothetical protein
MPSDRRTPRVSRALLRGLNRLTYNSDTESNVINTVRMHSSSSMYSQHEHNQHEHQNWSGADIEDCDIGQWMSHDIDQELRKLRSQNLLLGLKVYCRKEIQRRVEVAKGFNFSLPRNRAYDHAETTASASRSSTLTTLTLNLSSSTGVSTP